MINILILIGLAIGLLYKYIVWNFGHWRKLGIKEAKSWPFVGSFPSIFTGKRNLVYDIDEMYTKYKRTDHFIGVINTRVPQILITTPEYAYKVYATDFRCFHDNEFGNYLDPNKDLIFKNNSFVLKGAAWKECRAEITPGFTINRIAAIYPCTLKACEALSEFIRKQMRMRPADGLDAKQLTLHFTAQIVFESVLGIEANSYKEGPNETMTMVRKAFSQANRFITFSHISKILPVIPNFLLIRLFPKDVSEFFEKLMLESLNARKKLGKSDRIDFINYLLELQEKKNVGIRDLASHALTFLINGFESSSSTISNTLLMLARYPDIQSKLRDEIGTKPLTFTELRTLPYLNACIMETLRIWPVQMIARKICTEPCEFVNMDGTRLIVKPGEVAIVPVYSIHLDPDVYENPHEYRPERFLPENGSVKEYMGKGIYYGYGVGPRVCTGVQYSFAQIKAAIVEILRNFDVKLNKRTRNDNLLEESNPMAQIKGGIWLEFIDRCPSK